MPRTIVIADVHGCLNTLKQLLSSVCIDVDKDTILFLGDYIDRGKHSYETVEFLIDLQEKMNERCICLLGNHEEFMLQHTFDSSYKQIWKQNGGTKTIKSYFKNNAPLNKHRSWMSQLPLLHVTHGFVFCHAGLPHQKIEDNCKDDIIWSRNWIENMKEPNEMPVVVGHTPVNQPYFTQNGNLCIDTGCVFGYNLCAIDRKSTRLNSSHIQISRMSSSA